MPFVSQREPVLWSGVSVALLGAVYCALQAGPLGTEVPCPTAGCRLFHDVTVLGISLWWIGAAFFAVAGLLCLRRWRGLAFGLTALALLADCLLLLLMLVTAPCVSCLGAAAFIGLLFFLLRRHSQSQSWFNGGKRPSLLLLLWAGLFLAAAGDAGMSSLGRWTLYGPPEAERRIYFSPSCPACRDAVAVFANSAAFVPVAEKDGDVALIARMQLALAEGKTLPQALAAAEDKTNQQPVGALLTLRLRLLRNKAEVLRLGFDSLPLIMINGMPQALRGGETRQTPAPARPGDADGLPPELSPLSQCTEGPVPCPPAP